MTADGDEPEQTIDSAEDGRGHAVVLGAGIAGLLAARVLAEAFDRVTVIDRDVLADAVDADVRRGAPQGRHPHLLLDRGRQIMEELFPGLTATLVARGAATKEVLVGSRVYLHGLLVRPTPTGLTSLMASRPLLEGVIREMLTDVPGVQIVQRTAATGLEPAGGTAPSRIIGVRVTSRQPAATGGHRPNAPGSEADRGELVRAELVVDATGRGSRAASWLATLALPRASEERVDIDLGYASRLYRRRPDQLDGHRLVSVSTMPGFRGGGAIALEGERWLVTLTGMLGDHPPVDPDGFEAFARTLSVPDVHDLVVSSEPLGDPVPYRFSGSLRRRYEHVKNPPEGFLAIGDAVCSVNPIYAHGMTVAAQQALALRDCLRAERADLPARLYRRTARVVDVAWSMATGADLRYPQVRGRRGPRDRILGAYAERLQVAAHRDAAVARALMRTVHMVSAPSALVQPAVVAGVVRFGLRPPRAPCPDRRTDHFSAARH